MAGELVAKYYAAREEVEKDVEGGRHVYAEAVNFWLPEWSVKNEGSHFFLLLFPDFLARWYVVCCFPSQHALLKQNATWIHRFEEVLPISERYARQDQGPWVNGWMEQGSKWNTKWSPSS